MGVYDELKARGMIAQSTNEEQVKNLLNNEKICFYIGFDPTADSLHVGHFVQIMVMAHMQRAGHTPIALFGGGTGMVGDPSGKTDMRKMLTVEDINHNISCFKEQMSALVDFSDDKAIMVNNADWLLSLNYLEFIRDIGVHFTVNKMLAAECYKQRLEKGGLTFFELNYMLMQSYDFHVLNQKYGCQMQLGGDDQWSNIIGGVELIRRIAAREHEQTGNPIPKTAESFGMTFTLLTTSEGKKMGKTENGAVWLDSTKTTPYEFYQYFRNVADADVARCLNILTFLPLEQIAELSKLEGSEINKAKEILAYEVTKLIHGEAAATDAQNTAKSLFAGGQSDENMPTTSFTQDDFVNGEMSVLDMLTKSSLCASKSEARRLVMQGGISIDDVKVSDPNAKVLAKTIEENGHIVVKKGKKVFHKITL